VATWLKNAYPLNWNEKAEVGLEEVVHAVGMRAESLDRMIRQAELLPYRRKPESLLRCRSPPPEGESSRQQEVMTQGTNALTRTRRAIINNRMRIRWRASHFL
jgi:hypothetical protein